MFNEDSILDLLVLKMENILSLGLLLQVSWRRTEDEEN
jgi:hypothetical protein